MPAAATPAGVALETTPHAVKWLAMTASNPLPAFILAAGRGERLRPWTDTVPKPLLPVQGRPLVEWHLAALARDGVRRVVINTAWLAPQFPAMLGDGRRWGLDLRYSDEQAAHGGALETAGGLATAWPLIDAPACWLLAGDAWVPGFRFDPARAETFLTSGDLAWLWMVPNPGHRPRGDFMLDASGRLQHLPAGGELPPGAEARTYSTLALVRPALVEGLAPGQRSPLKPWLDRAIDAGRLGGLRLDGPWVDVGTAERWQALG